MRKRVLLGVGAIVLAIVAYVAVSLYGAFAHNRAVVDGEELGQPPASVRLVKDGFVNVFVVEVGAGKLALVDAGNDKTGKALDAELARRKLDRSAVAAIFLTHGHADHTAACRLFSLAKVYALAAEQARIGSDCANIEALADGQRVSVGDATIEAFAVPGHTAGSAVYLARGVLYFGDSAGIDDTGAFKPAVRFFSSDPAQNVASLKALAKRLEPRASEVTAMAFGHTGSVPGLGALTVFAK